MTAVLPGTPTAAKWTSRDNNHRMDVQFDGGPEWVSYRRDRHNDLMNQVTAIITPDNHVRPKRPASDMYDKITSEFWRRVANHYNVSVDRARTHMLVTGTVPVAVQNLWGKATALMDGADVNEDDIVDDNNWR